MAKIIDCKSECDKWEARCEKIEARYSGIETGRKRQIRAYEKAIVKHKKKYLAYKVRLGRAINTLDRRRGQVAKLRAELAALRG